MKKYKKPMIRTINLPLEQMKCSMKIQIIDDYMNFPFLVLEVNTNEPSEVFRKFRKNFFRTLREKNLKQICNSLAIIRT